MPPAASLTLPRKSGTESERWSFEVVEYFLPDFAPIRFALRLRIRVTLGNARAQGGSNMPSTINLYLIGVWFCVGFFTGAGWAIAAVLVGRILAAV
jgi:hypothetical protein